MEWQLLAGVPGEDVRALLATARRRTFAKGEVVFHRGDPADSLHLVSKGRFKVSVTTPLGEPATIAIRGPGDSFGEMAILGTAEPRSATVEALEPGETFCVVESEFRRVRAKHPAIDRMLLDFLAGEVRTLGERLLEAYYVSAERRLSRRLVELSRLYRTGGGTATIPLTQEELAGLTGTSRATVNQALRALQDERLVTLSRGRTTVLDVARLAQRAR